jgi:hypothetical protein
MFVKKKLEQLAGSTMNFCGAIQWGCERMTVVFLHRKFDPKNCLCNLLAGGSK